MDYLKTVKIRVKLLLLFALVTLSLVAVSFAGTNYINKMKKQIDILYFKYLVQNIELNNLKDLYIKIESKNKKSKLHKIDKLWKTYSKHYKSKDEIQYFNYLNDKITQINRLLKKRVKRSYIDSVVADIDKLIEYKNKKAALERREFLSFYDQVLTNFRYIIFFILFTVIITLLYVFYSITKDQKEIEEINKKLKEASIKDPLTKLYNRRFFNLIFEKELKNAIRSNEYVTFMMIDIDYFKQYNDTYGHIEGDNALKEVADSLRQTFQRPKDFTFRLGGEEFGVLLIGLNEEQSALMAKKLSGNIKDKKIEHNGSKVADVLTISVGVVCQKADSNLSSQDFVSKADELLYRAKESGRDRFEMEGIDGE